MTHRKLWVLKTHMNIDKIVDDFQNLLQYFEIYRNIDDEKTKKRRKQQTHFFCHTQNCTWRALTLFRTRTKKLHA